GRRDGDAVRGSADRRGTLDLSQPVGLLLIAIMHFIPDDDDPGGLAGQLLAALPPGSFLALSHLTGDFDPAAWEEVVAVLRRGGATIRVPPQPRVPRSLPPPRPRASRRVAAAPLAPRSHGGRAGHPKGRRRCGGRGDRPQAARGPWWRRIKDGRGSGRWCSTPPTRGRSPSSTGSCWAWPTGR